MTNNQTIAHKLTYSLLFTLILFSLVTLAVSYLVASHKTSAQIRKSAEKTTHALCIVLQNPMWQLDKSTVEYIGQSFLENEMISGIKIEDRRGNVYYESGELSKDVFLNKSGDIIYNEMNLGSVTISVNSRQYKRMANQLFFIVGIIICVIIMVLAGITGALLKYVLKAPLDQLSKVSTAIAQGNFNEVNEIATYSEFEQYLNTLQDMSATIDYQMNELREGELKYRRLLDNLTGAFLFRYTTDRQMSYVSASVETVLGVSPEEFMEKRFSSFLTRNPVNVCHMDNTEKTLSGYTTKPYEIEIKHADGSYRWFEISELPVLGSNNNVTAAEGIAYDITSRKEAEIQKITLNRELEKRVSERTSELEKLNLTLTQVKDEAIRANNAKSTFLASMSHELRTPLNAILGISQLMESDDSLPGSFVEDVELINRSGEHLLSLINEVLEISRIESGHLRYEPEDFSLSELVTSTISILNPRARTKNITLTHEIDPQLPEMIRTDARKLRQLILNLVGNSIKFTHHGGVKCEILSAGDSKLMLKIIDTGIGITKEEIKNLFQPFTQTESGRSSNTGTGLGLYISYQFAKLMQGDIRVESAVDSGTIFYVTLTYEEFQGKCCEKDKHDEYRHYSIDGEKKPLILIVDDNRENQKVFTKTISESGCAVKSAWDGEDAIHLYKTVKPDFIWMDIQMPHKDGIEAAHEIRMIEKAENLPHCPIYAISARVFTEELHDIVDESFDGFIAKPFKRNEVFTAIESALGIEFTKREIDREHIPVEKNSPISKKPIFVLDDNSVNLKIMSTFLERNGYCAEVFSRSEEMFSRLKEVKPFVAFFDIRMPRENGFDIMKRFKHVRGCDAIPVAMFSASDDEADHRTAISMGANAFFTKPFQLSSILTFVKEWTE